VKFGKIKCENLTMHLWESVSTLHTGGKEGIVQQISNRKSISHKIRILSPYSIRIITKRWKQSPVHWFLESWQET